MGSALRVMLLPERGKALPVNKLNITTQLIEIVAILPYRPDWSGLSSIWHSACSKPIKPHTEISHRGESLPRGGSHVVSRQTV